MALWLGLLVCAPSMAQETVCARVKIEIKQELTLERQAFDAELKITNSLPLTPLTEVNVVVKVTDEIGTPVPVTEDPNDLTAKFFLRQTQKQNIDNTSGTGQVAGGSTATVNWMLIPAPGAAGNTPFGKRYLVGATLSYRFGTETHVLELNPDAITVKPLPSLTLDYFLTRDVIADDPFTAEIEAPEPYTLGVRVKNSGMAPAQDLKIASAQPRIIDNAQGLPITFQIIGSYVQDLPTTNSLLIDFGDIPPDSSKMGRWQMESNLAGKFVDFNATFTHSDELGGALTSLLQATNAHLLLRDVRVDLPGRDFVRDFLAIDGTALRVYESAGPDSEVTDRSAEASLSASGGGYRLSLPPSQGFFYVRKADPYNGQKALGPVMRADAKAIAVENVWLSRTKNPDTQQWQHWFNVFDVNSPGSYDVAFKDLSSEPRAPVLQFIPDRVVKEGEQLGFLVEASSPMGRAVTLSADPLPQGATFSSIGEGVGAFDWTPEEGQAGDYIVHYTATDGELSATRSAKIRVDSLTPPPAPATPTIFAPLTGSEVAALRPRLEVITSEAGNDPTQTVRFELYRDESMTDKVSDGTAGENPVPGQPTGWKVDQDLNDNTFYYWRARAVASDGVNSEWVVGRFFVNLFNDPPSAFNLTSPAAEAVVSTLSPTLALTNAVDRDHDAVSYEFLVYADAAMTQLHDAVEDVPAGANGMTEWTVSIPMTPETTYFWRAVAVDEHGARTQTPLRPFTTPASEPTNTPPTVSLGSHQFTAGGGVALYVESEDADGDAPLTVHIELDMVSTFDSSSRRVSGPLTGPGEQEWVVEPLQENQAYFWRAKVSDGQAESGWTVAEFFHAALNDPPTVPVLGAPGDGVLVFQQYPIFEVQPSTDPDNDPIRYEYLISQCDSHMSWEETGVSDSATWNNVHLQVTSGELTPNIEYCWKVRALDDRGGISVWSPVSHFTTTSEDVSRNPTISLATPATLIDARDTGGILQVEWEGTDPHDSPTVALYHDRDGAGFDGVKIVDGLSQPVGKHSRSYQWSTAGLPSGSYHVYGEIYDRFGVGRAYAPGVLVVPEATQLGGIKGSPIPYTTAFMTREGFVTDIRIALDRAPVADVVVPVTSDDGSELQVQPTQLVFTPQNWSQYQTVKVTAVTDFVPDGLQWATVSVGKASSVDPHYMGLPALDYDFGIEDEDGGVAQGPAISGYQLMSKVDAGNGKWTYRYRVSITNHGPYWEGVTAIVTMSPGFDVSNGQLYFGPILHNETLTSTQEVILTGTPDLAAGAWPPLTWFLMKSTSAEW